MLLESPEYPDDEWGIDFDNPKAFALRRWNAICQISLQQVSEHDRRIIAQSPDLNTLVLDIRAKLQVYGNNSVRGMRLDELGQFLRVYRIFDTHFIDTMKPDPVNTSLVFGTLHLVMDLCGDSVARLSRVMEVLTKVQRQLDLFTRCNVTYNEEKEVKPNMVIVLEHFESILVAVVTHMHEYTNEATDAAAWVVLLRVKIEPTIAAMGDVVDHLHSIAAFTTLRGERQTQYVRQRTAGIVQMTEHSQFPCVSLPRVRDKLFWGREEILHKIDKHLNPKSSRALRTYSIYGRRGVGKTYIALEYAFQKEENFDAIFWIQCETAASLRISYTNMATTLKLPGAVQAGPHEDNLRLCHDWLRKTEKRWLLIFDNAEDVKLLYGYWPQSNGAILITSRKWINFNFDPQRDGTTVNTFDEDEREEILAGLLGWKDENIRSQLSRDEIDAAKDLLDRGQGLGLAIGLSASLIKSRQAHGSTIRALLHEYDERSRTLPPRPTHTTLSSSHAVDTLWSLAFADLTENAKALLSVLCLLSPDVTYVEIFNPKDQSILSPYLDFCGQETRKIANLSTGLQTTIKELSSAGLLKREGRILSVHRVVQEAFFHIVTDTRQAAFDAAARLVHEAFPKQINGRPLHPVWEQCETHIQDALFVAYKFNDFRKAGAPVSAPEALAELIRNAAWYTYEVGEHEEAKKLLKIAFRICTKRDSLLYAHFCNTAGVIDFELNHLQESRESMSEALRIRRELLKPDDEELANSVSNMGNIECAEDNIEKALELFNEAENIRTKLGEEGAIPLAITYLTKGRAYYLLGNYDEALDNYNQAETVALRFAGRNSIIVANVHYAIGNLERSRDSMREAKRHYDEALNIYIKSTPMHIQTSCTFYKLGCVEASLGNINRAKRNLERAFEIGDFRRTGMDDGNIARILWKQGSIIGDDPFDVSYVPRDAAETRTQAQLMRAKVEQKVRMKNNPEDSEEIGFDKLVCGFYR